MSIKKFLNKFVDADLRFLLKGSYVNLLAKIASAGFMFLATALLTRNFGIAVIGEIGTILSYATIIATVCMLGNQTLLLKLIPQNLALNRHRMAIDVYQKIHILSLCIFLAICSSYLIISFFSSASQLTADTDVNVLIFLIAISLITLNLNSRTLRGLGDFKIYSLLDLAPAAILLIIMHVIVATGFDADAIIFMYFFPQFILAPMSFTLVYLNFKAKLRAESTKASTSTTENHKTTYAKIFQESVPMAGITVSSVLIANINIIMLKKMVGAEAAGLFTIFISVALLSMIATKPINSMFAPKISFMFQDGNKNLKGFAKKTTAICFASALVMVILLTLISEKLFLFYGIQNSTDTTAFSILLTAELASVFFGSVGFFLNMTGNSKFFFKIIALSALLNLMLNLILIPKYGVNGAAVATLTTVIFWNILSSITIYKKFGYTLLYIPFTIQKRIET